MKLSFNFFVLALAVTVNSAVIAKSKDNNVHADILITRSESVPAVPNVAIDHAPFSYSSDSVTCDPGTDTCNAYGRFIIVCNSKGKWQLAASCDKSCCVFDTNNSPYCMCGPTAEPAQPSLDGRVDLTQGIETSADQGLGNLVSLTDNSGSVFQHCDTPGMYTCNDSAIRRNVQDAPMGALHVRSIGAETAVEGAAAEEQGDIDTQSTTTIDNEISAVMVDSSGFPISQPTNAICQIGYYGCSTDLRYLIVCDVTSRWRVSVECGLGCCKLAANGLSFCDCRKLDLEPQAIGDVVVVPTDAEATATGLNGSTIHVEPTATDAKTTPIKANIAPGISQMPIGAWCPASCYGCATNQDGVFQYLMVCDAGNHWKLAADCGPGCCKFNNWDGIPYCDCRKKPKGEVEERALEVPQISAAIDDKATAVVESSSRVTHAPVGQPCPANTRSCSSGRYLMICDATKHWRILSDCGGGCCKWSDINGPYCDCRMPENEGVLTTLITRALDLSIVPTTVESDASAVESKVKLDDYTAVTVPPMGH